ncbi:MAG: Fic family protein [Prevotellaceae bacterium]|nr:Fic family protein [Prevotellaceae bacterium]
MEDFDEYIKQPEPHKREKGYAWQTAIGLQAVDGLTPSEYLIETARRDIEGEITIDEAAQLIKSYYQSKKARTPDEDGMHEADIAATNIRRILAEQTFAFTVVGLTSVHRRIFNGVFKFAGKMRDYNITKEEWVLRGDTVRYVAAPDVRRAVEYDLEQERVFDYSKLNREQMVEHIAKFVSGLWQIHPFGEGNTRTTAVFTILYLRSMGFNIENDLFAKHSWYFRNALVRDNYQNLEKGIMRDSTFLVRFFRNLLLGENNELLNRTMLVGAPKTTEDDAAKAPHPTSTLQVPYNFSTITPQVQQFIMAIDNKSLSVKEMMASVGLKDRVNFFKNYLNPALEEGLLQLKYPDKPNHPRQQYLLTAKGQILFSEIKRAT